MKYRDIINNGDLHYAVSAKIITIMEAMEIEEERVLLADQDLTEEEIEFFYQYKCFSDDVQRELDIKYYGADWINT